MTLPRVLRLFASKTLVFTCFVAGILLQLVLATLLAIVLPQKIAIVVPLIAPFVIGSISYFIFGWITHRRTVRHEAERWLASGAEEHLRRNEHPSAQQDYCCLFQHFL